MISTWSATVSNTRNVTHPTAATTSHKVQANLPPFCTSVNHTYAIGAVNNAINKFYTSQKEAIR
jgi:hypothetical protein